MDFQTACAQYQDVPTRANQRAVLGICQRGLLADQRQAGSTPVRVSVWQQRLLAWNERHRCRRKAGQMNLFAAGGGT